MDKLTLSLYSGSFGGRTKVRPVAAAKTTMISRLIRTLFHPPRSIVNEIYFSAPCIDEYKTFRQNQNPRQIRSPKANITRTLKAYLCLEGCYELLISVSLRIVPVSQRVHINLTLNMTPFSSCQSWGFGGWSPSNTAND
jgi:hypothetical protein